jgi:hypothetical protein
MKHCYIKPFFIFETKETASHLRVQIDQILSDRILIRIRILGIEIFLV